MKYFFKLKYFAKHFLLIISMFFYSFTVFSQNSSGINLKNIEPAEFIAAYSLTYKRDSLNLDNVRNQEMWLFLGKNISCFVSKSHYIDIQAMSKHKSRAEIELWHDNYGPYNPRSLYHIYKNYSKAKITFIKPTLNGTFKYEENLDDFNWKLTQDTSTIGGYFTQKACCDFGGRKWTAWFSPEIPFKDGPYKFNGLPGLIVKIYDSREHYVFELIGIEIAEPDLMITINDYPYIKTTKQKYFRTMEVMRNSMANIVKQKGGDDYSQQRAAKNTVSRNNPIELK